MVITLLVGFAALACLVIANRSYGQEGPLYTAGYLAASPEERKEMRTPSLYTRVGNVYSGLSLMFTLVALGLSLAYPPLFWLAALVGALTGVYVVFATSRRRFSL